ncbi:MAG: putative dsRNA-binding protein [Mariprofundales bacterium]|nr:putative dsRNA-binding protein [Mariprofundales bacterium]
MRHSPRFEGVCTVVGQAPVQGFGGRKKDAEKHAAQFMLAQLQGVKNE